MAGLYFAGEVLDLDAYTGGYNLQQFSRQRRMSPQILCIRGVRMDKHFSVAIDGPSGAGKSTIARAAAARFGFIYVDTGALCGRPPAARAGQPLGAEQDVLKLLPGLDIAFGYGEDGAQHMYLNGEDVSGLIRTPEISMRASEVSAMPEVRACLLDMQRKMAESHSVIMDGRDIGTVVLPNASLKIFLTASPERRAERRYLELREKGATDSYDEVLRDIIKRDKTIYSCSCASQTSGRRDRSRYQRAR